MGRLRIQLEQSEDLQQQGLVALDLAIELEGSAKALGAKLGVHSSAISHWRLRDKCVPLDLVPHICTTMNHPKITPYTLRPDLANQWKQLLALLTACDEGRGRKSALDLFEINVEKRPNASTRTLRRIARELTQSAA